MKQVNGCWLPDDDTHFSEMVAKAPLEHGFPEYQASKRRRSLQFVKRRRCAIDVGAHVGLWSRPLALAFDKLIAFEPDAARADCWRRNMDGHGGLLVLRALDEVMRLDDEPDCGPVDYLKIDTEGTELRVLQGAVGVLERHRPVVCVEQKPGYAVRHGLPETGAIEFLTSLGAVLRENMNGVYVLSWEES